MEGGEYKRGRGVPGSHTYVDRDTPENERIKFHGISEGEKQSDDIREVGKHEVQVPEP